MKARLLFHLASALALALLAGLVWQWYRDRVALSESDRWENHTYEVMLQLDGLLSALTDTETGQRGFLLTGTEEYLQPYHQALGQIHQRLASLQSLTQDNPRQQQHLAALEPLIRDKLSELQETIDLRRTNGLAAASRVVTTGRGQSLMEQIRRQTAQAQAEEARLLKARTLAKEAGSRSTFRLVIAESLSSGALLLAAFLLLKRQQAEEALRQSEERLRLFIDHAPAAIAMFDKDMRYLAASHRWLSDFGLCGRDFLGRSHYDLFPEIPERWQHIHRRCLAGAVERAEEDLFERADGTRQWIRWEVRPWYGAPDTISGIIIFSEEITARKETEEALRQSEAQFRTMVDAIPQLAWIARSDGHIFWYNRRCYEYTGATPEQLEGWGWQGVTDPQALPKVLEQWRLSLATGQPFYMPEVPLRGADGRCRPFLSRVLPLKDDQGQVTLWFGTNTDIAELKQAQETASRSQRTFSELVERAPFGIYIVDSQFRIAHMNAGSQNGAFRNVRPAIGRDLAEAMRILWPEPLAAEIIVLFRHTLETGEPYYSPRFVNPRHDIPAVEAYEWELHRMRLPDGQYGVICYYFDSTKLHQAEAAVRESEERFRTMADAIPQLAWIARSDGYIFWYNRRWYQYTGTTPQQMEGWGWQSVHDSRTLPAVLERWKASLASGQPFDMTFPLRGADGLFRPFLTRVMPLKDEAGRVLRWLGTNTDVSQLHEAQEALKKQARLIDLAPAATFVRTLDGTITFWSEGAQRLYGWTASEALGQCSHELLCTQFSEPLDNILEHLRQGGQWSGELRHSAKDGRRIIVESHWLAQFTPEGEPLELLESNLDITERKRNEEDLRALKDELEVRVLRRTAELAAANRDLEDFAYIVAHDLKAPLRGVALLAAWLRTDYAATLDPKARQWLAQMNQRVGRLDRMIEGILEYSRLGRTEEKHEPVALARLVPLVVHDLAPPPHVRLHLAPGLPLVAGEPVRLRQVFQNLIGNAIKYADKPNVDIAVEWADIDASWEFRVTDNGPGIEEEHFQRIFKMFQTLAPKDKTDSTGVGLALVKRIVEHAGGRVWVESRLGQGSTFHFTWPKAPQAPQVETPASLAA